MCALRGGGSLVQRSNLEELWIGDLILVPADFVLYCVFLKL